jgi:hypothetical protein
MKIEYKSKNPKSGNKVIRFLKAKDAVTKVIRFYSPVQKLTTGSGNYLDTSTQCFRLF